MEISCSARAWRIPPVVAICPRDWAFSTRQLLELIEPDGLKLNNGAAPFRIATGPDNNIWFTLKDTHQIGEVHVLSKTISTFDVPKTLPSSPFPAGITAGPDGNYWFTDGVGAVGQVSPETQVLITSPPPSSVRAGTLFGLTAAVVYTDTGVLKQAFQGNVSLALGGGSGGSVLGGTTTKTASGGVATFTDLKVNNAGTYTLMASAAGPASTTTAPFSVTADTTTPPPGGTTPGVTPPHVSAIALFTRKLNNKKKPVGKPIFSGFVFQFDTTMNPVAAGSPGNYQMSACVQKRQGRKRVTVLQPIGFLASFDASNNKLTLKPTGKQTFARGGKLTLVAAGITSIAGAALDGNNSGVAGTDAVYNIFKGPGASRTPEPGMGDRTDWDGPGPLREGSSRQEVADHLAFHVGEAEVAAGVAEGQPGVVQAHEVKDRGVEVVDVDRVLGDVDAVLVGRAVDEPAFTPPPASHDENAQ